MTLRFVSLLALVALFVACDSDAASTLSSTASPSQTVDATSVVTPKATATSLAVVALDLSQRRSVGEAYEATAWDDHRGVRRIPPPSVEVAEVEADVHRAGHVFGAAPASFAGVLGGDGCV